MSKELGLWADEDGDVFLSVQVSDSPAVTISIAVSDEALLELWTSAGEYIEARKDE